MSGFRIKTITVGQIGTNCYLCYQEGRKEAVITDPGGSSGKILTLCQELGVEPEALLLTHGHFDHIFAVEDLKRAFPHMVVYAGVKEEKLLGDTALNLSVMFGNSYAMKADILVKDGDILNLAGEAWHVLETPGHTRGSVCFYHEKEGVLLSGDTLFQESLGRTDFPTGNGGEILASIQEKLFALPEDTMVYPGHGDVTTIEHEKKYNPAAAYRGSGHSV